MKEERCENPQTCSQCNGIGLVGHDGEACSCARYYWATGKMNCRVCGACNRNRENRKAKRAL